MVKFVVASALLAAGVSSASQDLPDEGHATGWPPAWVSTPEFQDFLACTGTEDEWNAELLFPIRPVAPEDDDGGEGSSECVVMGAMPVEGITDDCCSSLNTAANAAVAGGDISTWLSADSCTGACGAAFSNVISVAANMGLVPAGSGAAWDGGCASFQPIEYCSIMGGQMSLEGIGLEAGACCQQLDVSLLLFCFVSFSLPPPK